MSNQKAKFFAQYWGQGVERYNNVKSASKVGKSSFSDYNMRRSYLELIPLSEIRDCDNYYKGSYCKRTQKTHWIVEQNDYLRSKGYALPWMGISVEEQISKGWVKLSTRNRRTAGSN